MNPFSRAVQRMYSPPGGTKSVPTSALLAPWKDNQPQWSTWDTARAIKEGFQASVWVYACVELAMRTLGSIPWMAFTREKGTSEWVPRPEHPLSLLVEYPNQFMSRSDVIQRITAHLLLGGNGLLSKTFGTVEGPTKGKIPLELWPVSPVGIAVVPSRANHVARYRYEREGVKHDWEPHEIAHLMLLDPSNPYWGMSPLQAASRVVDTDVEAVKWNMVAMQNRAVPDGVFSFKEVLTSDQFEEARDQIRQQRLGATNAREPWALGGGAEWHPMSLTPAEMDFLESRKLNRVEICATYHTPPPMVGIYDDATLANIATARRIYWEDTAIPMLDGIQGALNRSLVPHFGTRDRLYLGYDVSQVKALRQDFGEIVKSFVQMTQNGIPINAAIQRLEMDIDPVEGGDTPLVGANMVPLALAGGVPPEDL